jgi:hypothetical protein
LRYLKSLSFFGKHNLAFGFNRPVRSEIWKTSSAFLKVPALHALAPSMPPTEPPFAGILRRRDHRRDPAIPADADKRLT